MHSRGGVRVRGGGFTSGRIGRRLKKPYLKQDSIPKSILTYRKPTLFTTPQSIIPTPHMQMQKTVLKTPQQQKQQISTTQSMQQQPQKSGLKLVLKRASGNAYKVTKTIDMNRPRREAAQKVKFVFSENEDDDNLNDDQLNGQQKNEFDNSYANIDDDSEDEYNYHMLQQKSSQILATNNNNNNNNNQIKSHKQPHVNNNSSMLNTNKKPHHHHHHQQQQKLKNDNTDYIEEIKPINFEYDEIVPQTIEEKMLIACKKPCVKINHSKPFPIALVEENTNVVYSKALLLNHLFMSYSSPCILCPLCRRFLSVAEFSKHIHNDNELLDEQNIHKSFNILPYRTKNQVTEYDMNTWKLFGKRYTEFKKERLMKREKQRLNQKINQSSNKLIRSASKQQLNMNDKENIEYLNAIKLLNWNYVSKSKNVFVINKSTLEYDRIIDLDDDDDAIGGMISDDVAKKNAVKLDLNMSFDEKKTNKDDLDLSEDEDEERMEGVVNVDNVDASNVEVSDVNNEVKIEEIADENIHVINDKNNSNNEVDDHDDNDDDGDEEIEIDDPNDVIPTIKSRYLNLYDNQTKEMLTYICDNQYTIIPVTYIEYIDYIRSKVVKNIDIDALNIFKNDSKL